MSWHLYLYALLNSSEFKVFILKKERRDDLVLQRLRENRC